MCVRERDNHIETNIYQLPPVCALTGNWTCNLGMCSDLGIKPATFHSTLQTNHLARISLEGFFFYYCCCSSTVVFIFFPPLSSAPTHAQLPPPSYPPWVLFTGPLYMFLGDPSSSFPNHPPPPIPLVTVTLFFISMSLIIFCLLCFVD